MEDIGVIMCTVKVETREGDYLEFKECVGTQYDSASDSLRVTMNYGKKTVIFPYREVLSYSVEYI